MGYDDDARAGRVPFDQVVPDFDDPRLEGWVPVRQYLVPSGWRYELRDVRLRTSGPLFGRRELLLVYYDVVLSTGEREPQITPFEYERPRAVDLRELQGLFVYAQAISEDQAADGELVSAGGGPRLDRWVVTNAGLTAGNLDRLRGFMERVATGSMPPEIAFSSAVHIAAAAYRLGRQVREDELGADFEGPAATGAGVRRGAEKGGQERGGAQTKEAEAWRKPFLHWLQPAIAAANAARSEPMNADEVIAHARKTWPAQGFGIWGLCPSDSTLRTAIRWGQRQSPPLFSRTPAKRGRKKRAVEGG